MTRIVSLAVVVVAVRLAADGPPMPVERTEVVVLLRTPPLTSRAPARRSRASSGRSGASSPRTCPRPSRLAVSARRERLLAQPPDIGGLTPAHPSGRAGRLAGGSYTPQLSSTPQQIGAPALWGQTLDTAGQGVKIEIIDSGIDPSIRSSIGGLRDACRIPQGAAALHDREGDRRACVRAEERDRRLRASRSRTTTPATGRTWRASRPRRRHPGRWRPERLGHRTARTYLGNYKVFVETTSGVSPNANSPAIVAAIESAVADGMDVINFSGGEPEIEPTVTSSRSRSTQQPRPASSRWSQPGTG